MDQQRRIITPQYKTQLNQSKQLQQPGGFQMQSQINTFQKPISLFQPNQISLSANQSDTSIQFPKNNQNQDELCSKHKEQYVAYDDQTSKILCNKCIFEILRSSSKDPNQKVTLGQELENICKSQGQHSQLQALFIPIITKEVKKKYDQAYQQYKDKRCDVADIEYEYVRDTVIKKIREYCQELRDQVQLCEEKVQARIEESNTVQELVKLLNDNKSVFEPTYGNQFAQIKQQFDRNIQINRFASIVKNQDFYKNQIFKKIEESTQYIKKLFDDIKEQSQRVCQVQDQSNVIIQHKFDDIIQESIIIDALPQEVEQNRQINLSSLIEHQQQQQQSQDDLLSLNSNRAMSECSEFSNLSMMGCSNPNSLQWSNLREQYDQAQNLFSYQNFLLKVFNQNTKQWEILFKGDHYYQRFINLPGTKDVYLIGGARDFESDQTTNEVVLIRERNMTFSRKPMTYKKSKICLTIGSVKSTDNQSKLFIFAIGGQESKSTLSRSVERYNPRADMWQQMPSLCIQRSEASALVLDEHLYVFGGINQIYGSNFLPTNSIERLNLKALINPQISNNQKRFQVIELKLPSSCINVGLVPLSQNECLILGGFNERNLHMKYKMTSHINQITNQHDANYEIIQDHSRLDNADFFQSQSYQIKQVINQGLENDEHMYDEACMMERFEEKSKTILVGTYYLHEISNWGNYEIKSKELQ